MGRWRNLSTGKTLSVGKENELLANIIIMQPEDMTKSELVIEIQKHGKTVNPAKKKEELVTILKQLQLGGEIVEHTKKVVEEALETKEHEVKPKTDTEKIMDLLGTVVSNQEKMDKRITKIETGNTNEFKENALPEDVARAEEMNKHVDPRISSIIEKTLGVDFGVDIAPYDDKPGMLLTINVPQRLSPVASSRRPVKDPETGAYKIDPKTKQVIEEEYWPGDRRSISMGAADSFDTIQKHANRVRSFILMTYQKMNRPQPEFKIKQ